MDIYAYLIISPDFTPHGQWHPPTSRFNFVSGLTLAFPIDFCRNTDLLLFTMSGFIDFGMFVEHVRLDLYRKTD